MTALALVLLIALTLIVGFSLGAYVGIAATKAYANKVIDDLERDVTSGLLAELKK